MTGRQFAFAVVLTLALWAVCGGSMWLAGGIGW